ncbi:OmpA family protein [Acidobacteria bacterium AH-259-O06]|nr:OmpA family protein [Acidobacteria bacterium AH-259-O06]
MPAPELEVLIEPSVIRQGDSALLRWEAQNADHVLISHNIGVVETSGRIKFFPDETTTYEVIAEGPGGRVAKAVTVDVLKDKTPRISAEDLPSRSLGEQFSYFVKPVFFAYNSAQLSEKAPLRLDGNIRWLTRLENRGIRFLIEGHCDERGTEEYNLALGDRRAQTVMAYLVRHGIDALRMATLSLGEERPFDPRPTEEAWALNRRAHFVLLTEEQRNRRTKEQKNKRFP